MIEILSQQTTEYSKRIKVNGKCSISRDSENVYIPYCSLP
jgi:hypothetical protein